ncbi:efflux RND transporter periplasmic adaptor subunit [Parasaccharibacter sp. TMW2.1882]|uniref:Efflux RND transporter periplasmic adaptor subunit n=2 Tax=Acetobacterales TaxID=3120395 RepID=A0ABX4ZQ03_9PROT|nr:efflux RND transporter periplasmic adaptor subunit [Parasaccharibacter sp. TMW2.1885]MCL1497636.1 efflux RND transporter periplasmic adaptor subunit [Parasaccharibacter sp. TMW2.1882]MCL1514254.1 efflux RND transporter periplasmic adaptor subunit [Parasaccharibacter sp. TMW 2.1891]MCL1516066.1 efflux RND transporter periplasmic adaptor subunit [Parasaccharibacter sp. TMW2.1890]MPW00038.1 efflux RND transporter periplasmic adaptor subunit [Bombella apis]MUG78641.1 efflux RND transporter peri
MLMFRPKLAVRLSQTVIYGSTALLGFGVLAGCQKKTPPAPPPQSVAVMTLHRQSVPLETSLPGRTDAYEQAQIRPQVSGVLVSRTFEEGKDVQAGQPLYQIYIAPFQAAYDQARGRLMEAQASAIRAHAQLKRYKALVGPRAISRQEYDNALATARQADAEVVQAQAAVETAQVNLNYTHVQSPIDGRIGRTLYTAGTLVTANQSTPIAVVTRLDPIYVDVNLAAEDMIRLRRELASGQLERNGSEAAVTLELPDGSTYGQTGQLKLSEVTVDPGTGTLVMRAVMPNPDKLLLPGMFVHAHIKEGSDPNALLLPQVGVQRTPKGEPYVMVVDGQNHVHLRMVGLGQTVGARWMVTRGLKDGERVIVEGLQKVHPEGEVRPHEVSLADLGME